MSLSRFARMFHVSSARIFQDRSVKMCQDSNAAMFLSRSAKMFPANSAKMFQGRSVKMFQGSNAAMFLNRSAKMFLNSPAEVFPDNNVQMCQDRSAAMFPGRNATRSVRISFGARSATKLKIVNSLSELKSKYFSTSLLLLFFRIKSSSNRAFLKH